MFALFQQKAKPQSEENVALPQLASSTAASDATPESVSPTDGTRQTFAEVAESLSTFGVEMVDVCGAIESANDATRGLTDSFVALSAMADQTCEQTTIIRDSITSTTMVAEASTQSMADSRDALGRAASDIARLIEAVSKINTQLQGLQAALGSVSEVSTSIDQIARQTNLLALNATIEAARAGEAGKGFAVVAGEVKQLAAETSQATQQIQSTLVDLHTEADALIALGQDALAGVSDVKESTGALDHVIEELSTSIGEISSTSAVVEAGIGDIEGTSQSLVAKVATIQSAIQENNEIISAAAGRIGQAVDETDRLVGVTADSDLATDDGRFLSMARKAAAEIEAKVTQALETGAITVPKLFDRDYAPVSGTDPQQVVTAFTDLADRLFADIQEEVAESDPRIVFCAAVDVNGYLPTHNAKFSKPQGSDPIWNNANSRNRRMFDDKVGLRAGRNTDPFLIQSYRRDMGGGAYAIMKDLSLPLHFGGRHWGALRLAYKV